MYRYFLYLIFVFFVQFGFGQTPPVAAPDRTIVNYSFSTRKMDVLPFDRPFVFHLTDLPTTTPVFNYIRISIIRLKTTKPTAVNNVIREDDPANAGTTYKLNDWTRAAGQNSLTSIDVLEPFLLNPSSAYQVAIELGSSQKLVVGSPESIALREKLKTDHQLDGVVNDFAKKTLAIPGLSANDLVTTYQAEIIKQLRQSVKLVNPAYNLDAAGSLTLGHLADFQDAMVNLKNKLHALDNVPAGQADIDKLKADREAADWYTITKNNEIQTDITALLGTFAIGDVSATHNTATNLNGKLQTVIATRDQLIDDLLDSVILPNVQVENPLSTTYNPDFVANASFYVNLDLGYAYVWRIDRGMAYSGFNFYFRPIDKTIPLSSYSGWNMIATRTSLLVGVTFGSVEKATVRKGLIGTQALVTGVGFKLNPFLKINGGWFLNYRYDQNPLVTQNNYHFSMSPFVSFSLDLDVKPLLTGLSDAIFK